MISLSADGYKKGDRCVVKAGRGEWFVGTIRTSGAKLGIDFDDGAKATVEEDDFKDVKVVGPKAKKNKATLSTQEAKAFREKYPVSVIVPKAKVAKVAKAPAKKVSPLQATKPTTVKDLKAEPKRKPNVPKANAAPVNKAAKTTSALPPADGPYPLPGYIFTLRNQQGEFIVNDIAHGHKLLTIKYYKFNTVKGSGLWVYKLRMATGARMPFTYVRKATDAEYFEGVDKHKALLDKRQAIVDTNKEVGNALGVQIGDVVSIKYSNLYSLKNEIVTDINHKTGKVAISTWRDRLGKKRRFIPMKAIKAVAQKGPGYYDANNQMYAKY